MLQTRGDNELDRAIARIIGGIKTAYDHGCVVVYNPRTQGLGIKFADGSYTQGGVMPWGKKVEVL